MHELAITESVVEAVAERVGETRVRRVVLEIGMLSGVLPDALRSCFDLCTEAALEIIEIPGRGHCQDCNTEVANRILRAGSSQLALLKSMSELVDRSPHT